ncbi:MAG TPA: PLDc N-terminal domain-containing protein [Sporosarcina sp.]|nr:PLDc N-terminal domain-containing protein [Sporosarcina sp.]
MNDPAVLIDYLPFLIPLGVLQIGLAIFSVIHIVRHPNYKFGTKPMWIIIVVFINFIGPILYFMFGKGDDQ